MHRSSQFKILASGKAPTSVYQIRSTRDALLAQTAGYLRSFNAAAESSQTAEELYDRMLALYPRRANPGALWGGAKAAKPLAG